MRVDAIGYLRSDISGAHQPADEEMLRAYAKGHGYNLRKIIVFGPRTDDPERRLGVVLDRTNGIAAVLVPDTRHFDGCAAPSTLTRRVDVVIVAAPSVLARLASAGSVSR